MRKRNNIFKHIKIRGINIKIRGGVFIYLHIKISEGVKIKLGVQNIKVWHKYMDFTKMGGGDAFAHLQIYASPPLIIFLGM